MFRPLRITMSLIRPTMRSRPSRSSARVAGAEPAVVERLGIVVGIDVAEEDVCTRDAALSRVDT